MPTLPNNPTPQQLCAAYSEGLKGWLWDDKEASRWESFKSSQPTDTLASIKDAHKKVDRAYLWRSREKFDAGAFGQEAQTTGDCVSHGSRNARDITRSVEIHIGGEAEEYYHRGATETTYGARGWAGQGMNPTDASRFERDVGFLVRKDYPHLGLDLSKYNSKIGTGWGKRGVPEKVKEECRKHNVGQFYSPNTVENVLDLLATGRAGHSGQSWGTSNKTVPDGLNTSNGSGWNHDMATVGYDSSRDIWKDTVFFVVNSWGAWNHRNPKWDESLLGPWVPGMIVVPISEYNRYFVRSGSIDFYSNVKGFELQHLPMSGFAGV